MGWTKWVKYKGIRMCPKCGFVKNMYKRKYIILGKIIKIQIDCDDCKSIADGKKKKRSPASLACRKTQVSDMYKKATDRQGRVKRTQKDDVREMKNFRRRKKKKSDDIQKCVKYLKEEEENNK